MVFDISKVKGIGEYKLKTEKERKLYLKDDKVFLVVRKNTIEVRCDRKLAELLREKYESVMESRYFGKGGIEMVLVGQLTESEIEDLVRHSYLSTQ